MERRHFLTLPTVALAARLRALADAPMPMVTLGKTGLKVSKFVVGGYHMRRQGEENGIAVIHRAMELGVNFFDSAWAYHKGASDETYGKAFDAATRKKVLLMSKGNARDSDGVTRQLEDTLRRMNTDYLDLWVCHEVVTMKEVDQILGPKGALESFVRAKKEGKVRHIGFSGHRDPAVQARLAESFDGWETVQMPINVIDKHYSSFIDGVIPKARAKGLGILAMKSNAMGGIGRNNIATIPECLRYTLSQNVDVVVSGVETVEQLEQNILTVKTFKPMTSAEMSALVDRTGKGKTGPEIENYKKRPDNAAYSLYHHDHA